MEEFSRDQASRDIRGGSHGPVADFEERRRVLDPGTSFHLEAPAGSGKTTLLTARFLGLLATVGHPREILALTFTNKAAAEMRERISQVLYRAGEGKEGDNPFEVALLDSARRALERHAQFRELLFRGQFLQIQTFHSFCFHLVTQAPLEAGISPGSVLMDEEEQGFFLREVIDEVLRGLLRASPGDPLRDALEDRLLYWNNSWSCLARELAELMERRESLGELLGFLDLEKAADYVDRWIGQLVEGKLAVLRSGFARSSLGQGWSDFVSHLESRGAPAAELLPVALPEPRRESLESWQKIADVLLTQRGGVRKSVGPASGFYSGFAKTSWFEAMHSLDSDTVARLSEIRDLPAEESVRLDLEPLWDLLLLTGEVIKEYEDRCRARRVLDFSSLETAALRLFRQIRHSDLELYLDQRIHHVLVDEFQDTRRQQWELLQGLCAEWTPDGGKTLFLVGDPKQSIYGFRKAEVRLFSDARAGLPLAGTGQRLPVEPVILRTNFRSHPSLIHWSNRLFSKTVMEGSDGQAGGVEFMSAVPAPEVRRTLSSYNRLALFVPYPDSVSARQREARWMADRIFGELSSGDSRPEIGILLFTRTHLPVYLEALQARDIAVRVAEGMLLKERPEALYLWQLCRALVLPQDHLAWASQLHSPWLTLGYREILEISKEEPTPWVEKIRVHGEKNPRVGEFWERLLYARQHLGHEPLADVLERTWLDLGGPEAVGERWGSRGLASSFRLLELVRRAEVHEPVQTLDRLEELLERAYEPIDPDAAQSTVSMMTVHRAKGLEFDSVYLPFCDWDPLARERGDRPAYLLERAEGTDGRMLLAVHPDRRTGEVDPTYRLVHRLRLDRRWQEAKRLFYVAVTRAGSRLSLSGVLSGGRREGPPSFPARTPLGWLNDHYALEENLDLASPDFSAVGEGNGPAGSPAAAAGKREWESREGDFRVWVEPAPESAESGLPSGPPLPEIRPAEFFRERPVFRVRSPSSLVGAKGEGIEVAEASSDGLPVDPALWGTLIHRILETWGREATLPDAARVRSYLRLEGMDEKDADRWARESLEEVEACLEDPFLHRLYSLPSGQRWVEWALESPRSERVLDVGVIDLVCRDGDAWVLVDFKTSRPSDSQDPNAFCRDGLMRYRPQVEAYRGLWARWKKIRPEDIQAGIYWTALRRWDPC